MIIPFWSPLKGKGCVTSTTILSALVTLKKMEREHNLITTTCADSAMISYFEERLDFQETSGMNGVEQLLNASKLDDVKLMSETTTLSKERLDVLPWTIATNESLITRDVFTYLNAMKGYSSVFMDLGGGKLRSLTTNIIDLSKFVIICIPQESKDLIYIRDQVRLLTTKGIKVYGVITPFDVDAKLTLKSIASSVGINKDDVFYIPYIHEIKDDFNSADASRVLARIELSSQKKYSMKLIDRLYEQLSKLVDRVYNGGF